MPNDRDEVRDHIDSIRHKAQVEANNGNVDAATRIRRVADSINPDRISVNDSHAILVYVNSGELNHAEDRADTVRERNEHHDRHRRDNDNGDHGGGDDHGGNDK